MKIANPFLIKIKLIKTYQLSFDWQCISLLKLLAPLLTRTNKTVPKGFFAKKFKIHGILTTPLVEKKCVPCKDLARFSFKVLQDNAFFCKTSCKNLARNKFPCKILARNTISLKDSCKEYCFLERFLQGKKIVGRFLQGIVFP